MSSTAPLAHRLVVADVLRTTAARFGSRTAASLGGDSLTFGELSACADHLACVLVGRGVRRGARVLWQGTVRLEAIALHFACAQLGAAFIPLNPAWSAAEAEGVIDLVDPDIVIGDGTDQVAIADLLAQRPAPGAAPEDPMVDERDPQVIFCTSGSTGAPKGVVLSQRTQRIRAMIEAPSHPLGPTLCMFPLFHMAGWQLTTAALVSGEEVVLVAQPGADELLEAIDRRRAAHLYAVPAVWRRILEADRSSYDLGSLVNADTGTSAVSVDLLEQIAASFPGTRTTVTYGSTEAGLVCRLGPEDLFRKPGSVGPPGIGVHARLDEDGQLLVASPYLMTGYLGDEQASAAALDGGWFHTGDLASRDAEGYFTIIGRLQDVIRTGGETVAPVEVDAVLATHPALVDAVVAGVPDDDWGEVVTAFVLPRPGRAVTLEELRQHCEGRLASYKIPRRMVVVDHIPRTKATLQVERRRLAALGARVPGES